MRLLSRLRRTVALALILLSSVYVAACESPSVFMPSSPQAQAIYNLLVVLLVLMGIIFVVVEGLLVYTVLRFSRPGAAPATHDASRRLEIAWTAAPAIVLAVLFAISALTLYFLTTQGVSIPGVSVAAPGSVVNVRAVGHQWWWEFYYNDEHITTAGEMHVPNGALVKLSIQSADVIHSFWVPQLGGKTDAIPGQTNHTMISTVKEGEYLGECSEFCGVEHAGMLFSVVVESPSAFEQWVKEQQAPPAVMSGDAARGEALFMSSTCVACHTVAGTAARGKAGPNLTHLASRSMIAGGVIANTPEELARWLHDPQQVKPGNLMVMPPLPPEDVQVLVDYLANLK